MVQEFSFFVIKECLLYIVPPLLKHSWKFLGKKWAISSLPLLMNHWIVWGKLSGDSSSDSKLPCWCLVLSAFELQYQQAFPVFQIFFISKNSDITNFQVHCSIQNHSLVCKVSPFRVTKCKIGQFVGRAWVVESVRSIWYCKLLNVSICKIERRSSWLGD